MKLDFRKDLQFEVGDPAGSPEFRKDFQPEGGDPAGSPEFREDFLSEVGGPAGRRSSNHTPCVPEARWWIYDNVG